MEQKSMVESEPQAIRFFHLLFGKALEEGLGEIEIRTFKKGSSLGSSFFS